MKKHRAVCGKGTIDGKKVILAQPQTYMNLSGLSVSDLVHYYKIDPKTNLIVIYDDVDLAPGQIRIRKQGSAGGHNGIKDIIELLGTEDIMRVKIGVDKKLPFILMFSNTFIFSGKTIFVFILFIS